MHHQVALFKIFQMTLYELTLMHKYVKRIMFLALDMGNLLNIVLSRVSQAQCMSWPAETHKPCSATVVLQSYSPITIYSVQNIESCTSQNKKILKAVQIKYQQAAQQCPKD